MKPSLPVASAIALLAGITPLGATVNVTVQVASLRDSSGVVISSTTTLWALVADTNGDGNLPGGLNTNESLTVAASAAAHAAFAGLTITNSLAIGGDQVLLTGEFNNANGLASFGLSSFDLAANGLAANDIYALYWFPGLTNEVPGTTNKVPTTAFQVGGINEITKYFGAGDNSYLGMKMPPDGQVVTTAVFDTNLYPAGALPTTRFNAINAIPEPSASLLPLLGLALLRRRR